MSMWQGDGREFTVNNKKSWLIAFMDDSSRLITYFRVFDSPLTENTLAVLNQGFAKYGVPLEILTDHGSQFVTAREQEHARHMFKEFLDNNGNKNIVASVKHPQTNGKTERFYGEFERKIGSSGSADEFFSWHNKIKPQISLDYDEPCNAFRYILPPDRVIPIHKNGYMCKLMWDIKNAIYNKKVC